MEIHGNSNQNYTIINPQEFKLNTKPQQSSHGTNLHNTEKPAISNLRNQYMNFNENINNKSSKYVNNQPNHYKNVKDRGIKDRLTQTSYSSNKNANTTFKSQVSNLNENQQIIPINGENDVKTNIKGFNFFESKQSRSSMTPLRGNKQKNPLLNTYAEPDKPNLSSQGKSSSSKNLYTKEVDTNKNVTNFNLGPQLGSYKNVFQRDAMYDDKKSINKLDSYYSTKPEGEVMYQTNVINSTFNAINPNSQLNNKSKTRKLSLAGRVGKNPGSQKETMKSFENFDKYDNSDSKKNYSFNHQENMYIENKRDKRSFENLEHKRKSFDLSSLKKKNTLGNNISGENLSLKSNSFQNRFDYNKSFMKKNHNEPYNQETDYQTSKNESLQTLKNSFQTNSYANNKNILKNLTEPKIDPKSFNQNQKNKIFDNSIFNTVEVNQPTYIDNSNSKKSNNDHKFNYPIHNYPGQPIKPCVKRKNKNSQRKNVVFNENVIMHTVESYKDHNVDMAKISKSLYKAEMKEGCTIF